MRKISLAWQENPCGSRPTHYEVWVKNWRFVLEGSEYFDTNPTLVGTTTDTNFYYEHYEDRGVLKFGICAVNKYGRGDPHIIEVDEVIVTFLPGGRWMYTYNGETVSGFETIQEGPTELTASIVTSDE